MSWLKKQLGKVKTGLNRQVRPGADPVLDDIRAYTKQPADNLSEYERLLAVLRNSASVLVSYPRFEADAKALWNVSYEGTLAKEEKIRFIGTQIPIICDSIERHLYMVRTARQAKASYFENHETTRNKIETRNLALDSVRKALKEAVSYVRDREDEYDTDWAGRKCVPLDDWTETEDFYRRLLQGIRNFTTWQPVFAKLDDAARFARTLADYEASAQEAEGFWHDWKERCRAYGEEQTELSRQRRLIMKEEEEYEHSGLWGRKPVFDFSRRGHHLEQHREELEDREDRLEEEWYDLQKEYKGYCNRVLDICDELCDYVIVLMDCLEEEKQSNIRNGEKLEADYEAGHEDIRRLDEEYERARHVLDTLTSLGGTEDGV